MSFELKVPVVVTVVLLLFSFSSLYMSVVIATGHIHEYDLRFSVNVKC